MPPQIISEALLNGKKCLGVCNFDLIPGSAYLTFMGGQHWQYGLPAPAIVGAFLFTTERAQEQFRHAPVLAGICLGIVASIQLAMGGFAAIAVAVTLAWRRQWRDLTITAGASMIIALPELLDLIFSPGTTKNSTLAIQRANLSEIAASPGLQLFIGLSALFLVSLVAVGPSLLPREYVPGQDQTTLLWIVVLLTFWTLALVVDARWYRMYAGYVLQYGLFCWLGVWIVGVIESKDGRLTNFLSDTLLSYRSTP